MIRRIGKKIKHSSDDRNNIFIFPIQIILPGVAGKFGLGVQNEAGQRLIEFCQENTLIITNTLPTTQEKTLHMDITRWSTPKSD